MSVMHARRGWLWVAILLTGLKIWLTSGQTIFAIGAAIHDDRLFADLAGHIVRGDWLGPYNQFPLAKGPLYPLFIAVVFWIGLPLLLAQQLLYAAACATLTRVLGPWLRTAAAQCGCYLLLLWNPISYDASNLSRLMRQNLYTPLALFTIAGLILLFARRRERWPRLLGPAVGSGLALGGFWLTREESVWLLPTVGLLWLGVVLSLARDLRQRGKTLAFSLGIFVTSAALPCLIVSTINLQHYGWFGTVEFRASEFKAAYGALTRPLVGPELAQVPVTRQMREALYEVSPAFAQLRPYLEGPVGDHWSEKDVFPAAERQMRGGWFVWALRDAVVEAGLAPDAAAALRYYQRLADEVNAACDDGRLPARGHRSGFVPPLRANLIRPLMETTLDFLAYFTSFSGFTARTPDSLGDYAELKYFRDLVGTRLSYAPRAPVPTVPEEEIWRARKIAALELTGVVTGRVLTWIGPLVLFIGLVRGWESVRDRRLSFPLGLAVALLAGCLAYLTINILVQVTSFFNQSPAALAAAYPLYLTALVAILLDAWKNWTQPASAHRQPLIVGRPSTRLTWWAAGGAAVIVFAAHLGEIHAFASDVPQNEQWVIEAQQILQPWLNGTLSLGDFFRPVGEHVPVWTRGLVWLQLLFTGKWDPLVQMTVNAAIYGVFVGLFSWWTIRLLRPVAATFLLGLVIFGGSLPHAWENITGGGQSPFPLALVLLVVHVIGACTFRTWSRGWWVAQSAALAGLFTLGSMWLAPVAVMVSFLWAGPRSWRDHVVPFGIAAVGAGLFGVLLLRTTDGGALSLMTQSPVVFFHATLHLLGWPSVLPGAAAIMQLPWLIHALRLRGQPTVTALDRVIFSLGLWNFTQVLLLAATQAVDHNGFISRYGDLLLIGVLAGGLALGRLLPTRGRLRSLFVALTLLWTGLVVSGIIRNSVEDQARYFHDHAAEHAVTSRTAVRNYLERHDRQLLDEPATRWILYHDPAVVTDLLDQPDFTARLPHSVFPANPPDAAGQISRWIQSKWLVVLAGGLVICLLGLVMVFRRQAGAETALPLAADPDPWRWRVSATIAGLALLLIFAWADPLAFSRERRWQQTLGGNQALQNLTFAFAGPSAFGAARLQGAAPIMPEILRNKFYGTAPDGPAFTGTVLSSAFVLNQPWLVVPYAGYPVGNGNGLRLRILDEAGQPPVNEIGCAGPNLAGIGYWVVDVHAYQGRRARLVLYDGRTDTEAWVAAAPPVPTSDPNLAASLIQRMQDEKNVDSHAALAVIALIASLCATISWFGHRRRASP